MAGLVLCGGYRRDSLFNDKPILQVMKQQGTVRSLLLLHRIMLLALVLLAAIAFLLQYTGNFSPSLAEQDQVLQLIAIAISFAGVFIGAAAFKKRIFQIRDSQQTLNEKSVAYRSACILQWALLEAAALFCIICFMLTGNLAFLCLATAIMLWFALTNPSKMKIMLLLKLSETEMEDF
jgi:FtsH-binding integral membrane protein